MWITFRVSFCHLTCWLCARLHRIGTTRSCMDSSKVSGSFSWRPVKIRKEKLSLLPNGPVYAVIFVKGPTIRNQKYGHLTVSGSVFGHLMRKCDDLCSIVTWSAQKYHNNSLLVQCFSPVAHLFRLSHNHIFSSFFFSDCSETIYLLIGKNRRNSFLSDTCVAAQTFFG